MLIGDHQIADLRLVIEFNLILGHCISSLFLQTADNDHPVSVIRKHPAGIWVIELANFIVIHIDHVRMGNDTLGVIALQDCDLGVDGIKGTQVGAILQQMDVRKQILRTGVAGIHTIVPNLHYLDLGLGADLQMAVAGDGAAAGNVGVAVMLVRMRLVPCKYNLGAAYAGVGGIRPGNKRVRWFIVIHIVSGTGEMLDLPHMQTAVEHALTEHLRMAPLIDFQQEHVAEGHGLIIGMVLVGAAHRIVEDGRAIQGIDLRGANKAGRHAAAGAGGIVVINRGVFHGKIAIVVHEDRAAGEVIAIVDHVSDELRGIAIQIGNGHTGASVDGDGAAGRAGMVFEKLGAVDVQIASGACNTDGAAVGVAGFVGISRIIR